MTGTIEVHSARSSFAGVGAPPATTVPAELTVEVVDPEGTVLDTQDVTAAADGTFTVRRPADAEHRGSHREHHAGGASGRRDLHRQRHPAGSGTGDWAADEAGSASHAVTVPGHRR